MAFKYIMFKHRGREFPVIFPDLMVHSIMADTMKQYYIMEARAMGNPDWVAPVPVSAGEVQMVVAGCSGRSETLKLDSRPFDASAITMFPYTHGVTGEEDT